MRDFAMASMTTLTGATAPEALSRMKKTTTKTA